MSPKLLPLMKGVRIGDFLDILSWALDRLNRNEVGF